MNHLTGLVAPNAKMAARYRITCNFCDRAMIRSSWIRHLQNKHPDHVGSHNYRLGGDPKLNRGRLALTPEQKAAREAAKKGQIHYVNGSDDILPSDQPTIEQDNNYCPPSLL